MYQVAVGATSARERRAVRAAARQEARKRGQVEITAAQWVAVIVASLLIGALFALVDPDFSESRTQALAAAEAEWSQTS